MATVESASGPTIIEGISKVEFDLSTVTADEMDAFFKAAAKNDQRKMAAVFPSVVKRAPASWGDKADVETYMKLPYFTHFKPLVNAFIDEGSGKN